MHKWENRDRKLSRRRSLKELNAGYKEPESDEQKKNKKLRKEVEKLMKALESNDNENSYTKDTSYNKSI
tara:strand:- start:384 stop:590 length:207 start_codon:yes stop_codon:yes gene_type:complete